MAFLQFLSSVYKYLRIVTCARNLGDLRHFEGRRPIYAILAYAGMAPGCARVANGPAK
jgi:hypothetical protein